MSIRCSNIEKGLNVSLRIVLKLGTPDLQQHYCLIQVTTHFYLGYMGLQDLCILLLITLTTLPSCLQRCCCYIVRPRLQYRELTTSQLITPILSAVIYGVTCVCVCVCLHLLPMLSQKVLISFLSCDKEREMTVMKCDWMIIIKNTISGLMARKVRKCKRNRACKGKVNSVCVCL